MPGTWAMKSAKSTACSLASESALSAVTAIGTSLIGSARLDAVTTTVSIDDSAAMAGAVNAATEMDASSAPLMQDRFAIAVPPTYPIDKMWSLFSDYAT